MTLRIHFSVIVNQRNRRVATSAMAAVRRPDVPAKDNTMASVDATGEGFIEATKLLARSKSCAFRAIAAARLFR